MTYETFQPSVNLRPFVKCYWTLIGEKPSHNATQTIVPDGCFEMIFHYGDLYRQFSNGNNAFIQPRSFVIGQLTKPLQIEPIGITRIFSVRFKPNGFFPFTYMPLKGLENKPVPLNSLFGSKGDLITKAILEASSTIQRIELIESFLDQLVPSNVLIDSVVKSSIDIILDTNGHTSINQISAVNKTSRRQLERKFSCTIGLSPKKLSKAVRMVNTIRVMFSNEKKNLTELAYENEYYDQSHFIKDFKEFTGFTPKAFYGDPLIMSKLFYGQNI